MPIYAYRCSQCGHSQDVLQKINDPLLSDCPACHQATLVKQITAAGFALKGSGYYATDFKNRTCPVVQEAAANDAAAPSCAGSCACH